MMKIHVSLILALTKEIKPQAHHKDQLKELYTTHLFSIT